MEENVAVSEVLAENGNVCRIAVAGCSHGELEKIYEVIQLLEQQSGAKIDLLICCGDFQSVRNYGDLHHMHVNEKFRHLMTFYKYYSGELTAPYLTLFIGGNHEASGFLTELPNGGWVAPNIYYMGFASVVRFAGLRIAGLSGIYNPKEFNRGHYERPPFSGYGDVVSAYHVRNLDMFRLRQLRPQDNDKLSNPIDIMISHDWPGGVADYGDVEHLFRIKKHLKDDIQSGKLGNPAAGKLLHELRPKYWLAAHLHVAYAALVPHKAGENNRRPAPTKFLSLDKPIPQRQFLQILEIEVDENAEKVLSHDAEWLAILKSTDEFSSVEREQIYLPNPSEKEEEGGPRKDFRPTPQEISEITETLGDLRIKPDAFRQTAPPLKLVNEVTRNAPGSAYYRNPQTAEFCQWLGIRDLNKMLIEKEAEHVGIAWYLMSDEEKKEKGESVVAGNQDDVDFGDEDFVLDRGQDDEPETKKLRLEEEVQ